MTFGNVINAGMRGEAGTRSENIPGGLSKENPTGSLEGISRKGNHRSDQIRRQTLFETMSRPTHT